MIIGITGASGAIYGIRFLEVLAAAPEVETHLVMTPSARLTVSIETDWTVEAVEDLANEVHGIQNVAAPISSGSFRADGMIVAPCSMKTLSAIVHSFSDNLLTRAADVILKERRRLALLPRETPLHVGHTKLLYEAAQMGVHIAPPVPAFYNKPQTLDDVINHTVGRVLDLFDIDTGIVHRWEGPHR